MFLFPYIRIALVNVLLAVQEIAITCWSRDQSVLTTTRVNGNQWEGEFDTAPPIPLNRWSLKLAWVVTSGTPTPVQNFITIRSGVFAPLLVLTCVQGDSTAAFGVLEMPYSQARWTDFDDQYVKRRRFV